MLSCFGLETTYLYDLRWDPKERLLPRPDGDATKMDFTRRSYEKYRDKAKEGWKVFQLQPDKKQFNVKQSNLKIVKLEISELMFLDSKGKPSHKNMIEFV
jgi:hypothetical protein